MLTSYDDNQEINSISHLMAPDTIIPIIVAFCIVMFTMLLAITSYKLIHASNHEQIKKTYRRLVGIKKEEIKILNKYATAVSSNNISYNNYYVETQKGTLQASYYSYKNLILGDTVTVKILNNILYTQDELEKIEKEMNIPVTK